MAAKWPTPQDYNEALQNPRTAFAREDLRTAKVEQNSLGLPKPTTGAFASVYKLQSKSADWAIRCFLSDVTDRAARYERLSNFIMNDTLPYTVPFEFIERGVNITGKWFPLVKMDWVRGITLDEYVRLIRSSQTDMESLATKFFRMCSDLRGAGIAHGDLQHGNILIDSGEIVLVDYDGMFVPSLAGMHSHELGHPSYQHPSRSAETLDENTDNFSAWMIYASLKILAIDPQLVDAYSGVDQLLFTRSDLVNPLQSKTFFALETHGHELIVRWAKTIRFLLAQQLQDIPLLEVEPINCTDLPLVQIPEEPDPVELPTEAKSSPNALIIHSQPEREVEPANQYRAPMLVITPRLAAMSKQTRSHAMFKDERLERRYKGELGTLVASVIGLLFFPGSYIIILAMAAGAVSACIALSLLAMLSIGYIAKKRQQLRQYYTRLASLIINNDALPALDFLDGISNGGFVRYCSQARKLLSQSAVMSKWQEILERDERKLVAIGTWSNSDGTLTARSEHSVVYCKGSRYGVLDPFDARDGWEEIFKCNRENFASQLIWVDKELILAKWQDGEVHWLGDSSAKPIFNPILNKKIF